MLADLVEDMKKTDVQAAAADPGPDNVPCDLCSDRKRKASKSCLQCLVSYCDQHLQPHHDVPPFKRHKLVEPSSNLQENVCSRHDELMKMFCRTDQQLICYLCSVDEHRGHDIVSAEAERIQKQKEVGTNLRKVQQKIEAFEKDKELLQKEEADINASAHKAVTETVKMSTELISLIKQKTEDMERQIRRQQRIAAGRVRRLLNEVEQQLKTLRRTNIELELLSQTHNYNDILKNSSQPLRLPEHFNISSRNVRPRHRFDPVSTAVSRLRDELKDELITEWKKISSTVTDVDVLLPQNPKTSEEFSHYSVQLSLDPNTVSSRMILSEGNQKVTCVREEQLYPPQPGRFMSSVQVLSLTPLSGRCYWEVEWSGQGVSVAVAYKTISRTGDRSRFGVNLKSWVLHYNNNMYTFTHNSQKKQLSGPQSSRIGVFVDRRAGLLIFYSVSDTPTLIHRVHTPFTEPLYAGLGLCYFNTSAKLCTYKGRQEEQPPQM
ncbi:tripartite motif-containing protein 16-like [Sphaeramia orbicularis]|uniref:tripartite motif-containing protein 16-like n=1 Tax=Sphaeramia orbicularis TaxID=375764 RepID=UPI001180BB2C|nr:tripartite motif-containing protein 16-like [Sphaeramia orbicularis]